MNKLTITILIIFLSSCSSVDNKSYWQGWKKGLLKGYYGGCIEVGYDDRVTNKFTNEELDKLWAWIEEVCHPRMKDGK
jgi:hypothetical protein